MTPLHVLVGAPRTIRLSGEPYRVSAMPLRAWGAVAAWLLDHATRPRPLERAARAALEDLKRDEAHRALVEHHEFLDALAVNWPPMVTSGPWWGLLEATEGGPARLILEGVRAHHPGFDEADAARLAEGRGPEEWVGFCRALVHGDPDRVPLVRVDRRRPAISSDDWGPVGALVLRDYGVHLGDLTLPGLEAILAHAQAQATGRGGAPRTTPEQARAILDRAKARQRAAAGNGATG